MKFAVTGSGGYIGSVTCRLLKEHGHEVTAIDWNGHEHRYFDEQVVECFTSDEAIKACLEADVIIHLAAQSEVGPSHTDPLWYFTNNTAKTTLFVSYLKDNGWLGRLIVASTAAVYADKRQGNELLTETSTIGPANNYGLSKLMMEQILTKYCLYDESSFSVAIFRFFNVAGAWDELGEPYLDSHLVSKLCLAALHDKPLVVYGDDYPTPDGTCVRDYIHVRDIARALYTQATDECAGHFSIFNLGTGKGTSVYEMVSAFQKSCYNIQFVEEERRPGDAASLVADGSAFSIPTKFTYEHSNLTSMLTSAWEHFKNSYNNEEVQNGL
jgi:UDP-glucose 4-epimerase